MCSEISEAVGTTWKHAQLEFQKFLKIRIPLVGRAGRWAEGLPTMYQSKNENEYGRIKLNTQTVATRVKLLMESITHVAHRTWMRVETPCWTWTCTSHPWVRPGSYWRNRWNKIISDWHKSWYVRGQEELVAKADYGKLPITTFPFRCGRHPWCQEGRRRYAMQKTQTTKSSQGSRGHILCTFSIFHFARSIFQRRRMTSPSTEHQRKNQSR